ncbi:malate-aspartate shuttle [Aureococcus anophagefferens]|nr:malate-aspartate shuttle [Aureococcus anophagefferens]
MSTSSSRVSFFPKLATGGVAGMLGVTAVFPVDLCKTRMQNGGAGSVQANTRLDVFRGVLRTEGFRGFYRGLVACGAGAAALQVTVTTPMEMVKLQCQMEGLNGGKATPAGVVSRLGARGLYRGFGATLAREIPFGAIVLPLYPIVLDQLSRGDDQPTTATFLASGVLAGGVAAGATCPLDVVKTRLQLGGGAAGSVVRQILRDDGPRGFFRGVGPRVAIFSGLYGMMFLSYECANAVLGI